MLYFSWAQKSSRGKISPYLNSSPSKPLYLGVHAFQSALGVSRGEKRTHTNPEGCPRISHTMQVYVMFLTSLCVTADLELPGSTDFTILPSLHDFGPCVTIPRGQRNVTDWIQQLITPRTSSLLVGNLFFSGPPRMSIVWPDFFWSPDIAIFCVSAHKRKLRCGFGFLTHLTILSFRQ